MCHFSCRVIPIIIFFSLIFCWPPKCPPYQIDLDKYEVKPVLFYPEIPEESDVGNMNSDENELNPSVKEALVQFRKSLSDVLPPDVTDNVLLKWLRAKNFHLKKSEELYRINLRCRQLFKFAELENIWRSPEVIEKYQFANYLGIAKDDTPIRYVAMGRGDLKGFYMSLDAYEIGKYCASEIEGDVKRCKEQSKKLGRDINEMTYIVDMGGFNLAHVMFSGIVEIGMDLLRMLQELHPEIWQNLLIVNAPFYFHTFFNFFKPILSYNFLSKVRVVSRDQSASLLLKYIDADVLPEFLGGKRVDSKGNPMCAEFMKFGGIVPEEYYLRNRSPLLPTDPGVEDCWVPPRGCLNIAVVVRKPNSTFHVEVRSEGGSLLSVILYRKFEFDPDEYIDLPGRDEFLDPSDKKHNVIQLDPSMHIHTHVAPINNYVYAPWPGIYIFRIDNSYNWFSGRRCIHRIRVEPPEKMLNTEPLKK